MTPTVPRTGRPFFRRVLLVGLIGERLLCPVAAAATFYVSPIGDDANDGASVATPWRTLARANPVLQPGDTLLLRGGEYTSPSAPPANSIQPARSGTAAAPITYRAYAGETPVLTAIPRQHYAIDLRDRSHIHIVGITIDGKHRGSAATVAGWGRLTQATHNTIRGCTFTHGYAYAGVQLLSGSNYNRILDNRFDFFGAWDDPQRGDYGETLELRDSSYNLIEGNTFHHPGHNSLQVVYVSTHNVIRRNLFDGDWSDVHPRLSTGTVGNRSVAIGGSRPGAAFNVFEYNVVRRTGSAVDKLDPTAVKIQGRHQIARFNLIHDNVHDAIRSDTIRGSEQTTDNYIYHNTLHRNGGPAWFGRQVKDGSPNHLLARNVFQNNLVYRCRQAPNPANANYDADVYLIPVPPDPADPLRGNQVIANSFVKAVPGDARLFLLRAEPLAFWQATAPFNRTVRHNLSVAPKFVSEKPNSPADFDLHPGCGLIDAGAFLTVAATAGADSTTLLVADAGPFHDGFGIVDPDQVQVGANAPVAIVAVDYEKNTLTLARAISWREGDGVSLPYHGAAPDIGAREYRAAGPTRSSDTR